MPQVSSHASSFHMYINPPLGYSQSISRPRKYSISALGNVGSIQNTIKSQIKDQTCCRFRKLGAALFSAGRLSEIGRIGPATDGKQHLQFAVLFLEQKHLLCTSIHIGSLIIPRIFRVMLLNIGPSVGQISAISCQTAPQAARVKQLVLHFSTLRADVGEGIQNMSQLVRG